MLLYRNSRLKYYGHREEARSNPEKCVTIIIDGMDQSKTNLPRVTQTPKLVQGLQQLRTHISGALVHTRSPHGKLAFAYYYVDMLQYPHDSNLTIHVLLSVLKEMKGKLPATLNLQLDNTSRQIRVGFLCPSGIQKMFKKVIQS